MLDDRLALTDQLVKAKVVKLADSQVRDSQVQFLQNNLIKKNPISGPFIAALPTSLYERKQKLTKLAST